MGRTVSRAKCCCHRVLPHPVTAATEFFPILLPLQAFPASIVLPVLQTRSRSLESINLSKVIKYKGIKIGTRPVSHRPRAQSAAAVSECWMDRFLVCGWWLTMGCDGCQWLQKMVFCFMLVSKMNPKRSFISGSNLKQDSFSCCSSSTIPEQEARY